MAKFDFDGWFNAKNVRTRVVVPHPDDEDANPQTFTVEGVCDGSTESLEKLVEKQEDEIRIGRGTIVNKDGVKTRPSTVREPEDVAEFLQGYREYVRAKKEREEQADTLPMPQEKKGRKRTRKAAQTAVVSPEPAVNGQQS